MRLQCYRKHKLRLIPPAQRGGDILGRGKRVTRLFNQTAKSSDLPKAHLAVVAMQVSYPTGVEQAASR